MEFHSHLLSCKYILVFLLEFVITNENIHNLGEGITYLYAWNQ